MDKQSIPPVAHVPGDETGTPFGWHYYTTYRECPRQFYYKHILGLVPEVEAIKPLTGKIFHAMKEAFYAGKSVDAIGAEVVKPMLERYASAFSSFDPPGETRELLNAAFGNWIIAYGRRDLETYDSIEVEQAFDIVFETPVGPVRVTGRIDFLGRRRDDRSLFLHDTKTSFSTGPTKLIENVDNDDQLTIYAAAAQAIKGEIPTCLADCVLFKGRSPQVGRGEFFRTTADIADALQGLVRTAEQIMDSRYRIEDGAPWRFNFPRYTQKCALWGCAYADFCRAGIQPGSVPDGFRVKPPYTED